MLLKLSTARNRPILMVQSSDHLTGLAGLTLTITASKDGAAFASITPTVTDLGSGWYNLALTTTHTNTLGALAYHVTGTSADPTDFVDEVVTDLPGVANLGVNVAQWNGTNVAAPATAGVPDVNVKNMNNVAATSITTVNANQGTAQPVNFTGTGASALVKSDMVDVAGAAVSTTTAQIGASVVSYAAGQDVAVRRGTAQAGAAGTITLDAGASATDSLYQWQLVAILSGTGVGQTRLITGYTGSSKVATVAPNWTTNPDSTSLFAVLPWGRANVAYLLETIFATPNTAGIPKVDPTLWLGGTIPAVNVTGVPKVDLVDWLGSAPNALVSGRPDASVGAMAAAVLTAAAIAADAITAAKIADGAIDRATFAADTGLQTARSNTAQAGAAGSITLDASASAVDDFYKGALIVVTGGTGAGQARVITAYVGSTKVASVDRAWATNPDNTSTFAVESLDLPGLSTALAVAITQAFPTNFSTLSIDGSGRVDISKWLGAAVNALIAGRVDSNAQALLAGLLTTAAFAVGAIDTTVLKADAKESIADTLLGRNIDGGSNTGRLVKEAIKRLRNRVYIATGTMHVTESNDSTDSWTAAVTTAAGNPVSDIDPA